MNYLRNSEKPVQTNQASSALEKEIARLKSGIAGSKQFKNKVELNLKLKAKENELKSLLSKN